MEKENNMEEKETLRTRLKTNKEKKRKTIAMFVLGIESPASQSLNNKTQLNLAKKEKKMNAGCR